MEDEPKPTKLDIVVAVPAPEKKPETDPVAKAAGPFAIRQ
jgi:hypothetical protein